MKIVKGIVYAVSIALAIWFVASWADIVADNCEPNPVHSKYNMFVLMTKQKEEPVENMDGQCGSPLTDRTRLATAIINAIDDNTLTLTTVEDGEQWIVEVGYGESFSIDDYLCVFFDTMETENIYDDEIVKLWVERW